MTGREGSLTALTVRAVEWRFASSVVGAICQFAVGVALARLLEPSDFGLMALASVVLGLAAGFRDLGLASAVVQRKDLTDRYVRAAFTFSVALGVVLAVVMALAAPLAVRLTGESEVGAVVRWLSLGFAVHGFAVVAGALLRRGLDYRRQFIINTTSYVVGYGAVALAFAILGHGVWSLVWGGLSQAVVSAIGNLISAPHAKRPLWARRELGHLLHFGAGASLSAWTNYLARNGDNFIIGRVFGAASLGLYTRAYSLMNLSFTYTASVMSAVLFPAMSQLQDETDRLRRAYLLMTKLTAAVSAPVMGALVVAAPYLIVSLYGPRWSGAIVPLQILAAFGYCRALYHVGGVVALSAGRVYPGAGDAGALRCAGRRRRGRRQPLRSRWSGGGRRRGHPRHVRRGWRAGVDSDQDVLARLPALSAGRCDRRTSLHRCVRSDESEARRVRPPGPDHRHGARRDRRRSRHGRRVVDAQRRSIQASSTTLSD